MHRTCRYVRNLFNLFAGGASLRLPLAIASLGLIACSGCGKRLAPEEYGEIIDTVPADLNQPYPLPELDAPGRSPLAGPESQPTTPDAEPTAKQPAEPEPPTAASDAKPAENQQ